MAVTSYTNGQENPFIFHDSNKDWLPSHGKFLYVIATEYLGF